MGLVDKFKNFVNPVDPEEDYAEDNFEYENDDNGDYGTGYEEEYSQTQANQRVYRQPQQQQHRPVNNYDYKEEPSNGNVEIKRISVERWNDVKAITNHLQNHRIIIIDISGVQVDLARRMLDFLYGVVFVIDGKLQKVDAKTWLATPSNVNYSIDKKMSMNNRQESSFIDSDEI